MLFDNRIRIEKEGCCILMLQPLGLGKASSEIPLLRFRHASLAEASAPLAARQGMKGTATRERSNAFRQSQAVN